MSGGPEPKPDELLAPTTLPDSLPPPLRMQHQIDLGDAASRLAEANPERLMNALETNDARSFEIAKMQIEIAREDRRALLDREREREVAAREERKDQRAFLLRVVQWIMGFALVLLAGIIAFAAYTGDSEIVRLLITAIASFAGGGAVGRATKTAEEK